MDLYSAHSSLDVYIIIFSHCEQSLLSISFVIHFISLLHNHHKRERREWGCGETCVFDDVKFAGTGLMTFEMKFTECFTQILLFDGLFGESKSLSISNDCPTLDKKRRGRHPVLSVSVYSPVKMKSLCP